MDWINILTVVDARGQSKYAKGIECGQDVHSAIEKLKNMELGELLRGTDALAPQIKSGDLSGKWSPAEYSEKLGLRRDSTNNNIIAYPFCEKALYSCSVKVSELGNPESFEYPLKITHYVNKKLGREGMHNFYFQVDDEPINLLQILRESIRLGSNKDGKELDRYTALAMSGVGEIIEDRTPYFSSIVAVKRIGEQAGKLVDQNIQQKWQAILTPKIEHGIAR